MVVPDNRVDHQRVLIHIDTTRLRGIGIGGVGRGDAMVVGDGVLHQHAALAAIDRAVAGHRIVRHDAGGEDEVLGVAAGGGGVVQVDSRAVARRVVGEHGAVDEALTAYVDRTAGGVGIVVVDLHANSLLDTTAGMSSSDILSYQIEKFHEVLDKYKSEKGRRIVFIHGKGEGVLRHAIVHELQYKYKKYQYQDASFLEYGYGATQVTIR